MSSAGGGDTAATGNAAGRGGNSTASALAPGEAETVELPHLMSIWDCPKIKKSIIEEDDKSIKVWDFINSSIAHTFMDVHTGPVWKMKFHDTGDFVLSASGDGSVKLFDLNSL